MEVSMTGSQMAKLGTFQGYDESVLPISLNVKTHGCTRSVVQYSAPAPASGAAEIACEEQQDFYVGYDGGYMIPIHSKMRIVEREWNERPQSSLSRERRSQFPPETRSEVGRNLQCERRRAVSSENQQSGIEYCRAVRS